MCLLVASVGCRKKTPLPPPPTPASSSVTTDDIRKLKDSIEKLAVQIREQQRVSALAPPVKANAIEPEVKSNPEKAATGGPAATPAAVRKPLGDYIPCLFTTGDDSFLRGRSLADAMKALAAQQMVIGRLNASNSAQVAAILLSASGTINAKTGDDRSKAINAVIDSLFSAKLLQTARTDNNDLNKAEGEVAFALTDALQTQGATQVASTLDVGCSQSLLSWEEARDIFGTRVANTYLVVQVIVRNLNSTEEFLMHDVQIALDATRLPINVTLGQTSLNQTHFVAGRDKMLARGVAVVGQQMDRRNFLIRVAEALGDVTLAAATATGRAHFIDGVSIYKSVLIPGLKSVYPDLTIDQLNRLNDLAFSSASAYKIVVPKSGSVPFVTFLPAKIFAAAPTVSSNPPSSTPAAGGGNAWQYKKWTQEQMLLLQESMYVVFAGVHVVEDTTNGT